MQTSSSGSVDSRLVFHKEDINSWTSVQTVLRREKAVFVASTARVNELMTRSGPRIEEEGGHVGVTGTLLRRLETSGIEAGVWRGGGGGRRNHACIRKERRVWLWRWLQVVNAMSFTEHGTLISVHEVVPVALASSVEELFASGGPVVEVEA